MFYVTAEIIVRPRRWYMVFPLIIPLLALGVGMAVNNAKAVLEAMAGQQSEFVRTPKFGESSQGALSIEKRAKGYKAIKSVLVPLLELCFAVFFGCVEYVNLNNGDYLTFVLMTPFLGFFYTSFASIARLVDGAIQKRRVAKAA
jgi:hypothetical protein